MASTSTLNLPILPTPPVIFLTLICHFSLLHRSEALGAADLIGTIAKNAPNALSTLGNLANQQVGNNMGYDNNGGVGQTLQNAFNTGTQLLNTFGGNGPTGQQPGADGGTANQNQQGFNEEGQQHEGDLTNEVVENDQDEDEGDEDGEQDHSQQGNKRQRLSRKKTYTKNDDDDDDDEKEDQENEEDDNDSDGTEDNDDEDDEEEEEAIESRKRKKSSRRSKKRRSGSLSRHKTENKRRKKTWSNYKRSKKRRRNSSSISEESYGGATNPFVENIGRVKAIISHETTISGICEDDNEDDCARKKHLCSLADYKISMHNACPVTCLVCKKGSRKPSYKEHSQAKGCSSDADETDCLRAASMGYCSELLHPKYKDFMNKMCPIICGKC